MKSKTSKKLHLVDEESKDFAMHFKKMVEKNFREIIKYNKPIVVK